MYSNSALKVYIWVHRHTNSPSDKEGVNRTEKSEENPSFLLKRSLQGEGDTVKETGRRRHADMQKKPLEKITNDNLMPRGETIVIL